MSIEYIKSHGRQNRGHVPLQICTHKLVVPPTFCNHVLFLPRDAMLARYQLSLCVCPSVCLSQVGVVQRQLNLQDHIKSGVQQPRDSSFPMPKSCRNSNDITPNGGAKQRCGRFLAALCGQYLAISQKRCKIGTQLLWKANRNLYAL